MHPGACPRCGRLTPHMRFDPQSGDTLCLRCLTRHIPEPTDDADVGMGANWNPEVEASITRDMKRRFED